MSIKMEATLFAKGNCLENADSNLPRGDGLHYLKQLICFRNRSRHHCRPRNGSQGFHYRSVKEMDIPIVGQRNKVNGFNVFFSFYSGFILGEEVGSLQSLTHLFFSFR